MNLPIAFLRSLVARLTEEEWEALLARMSDITDAWNEGDSQFKAALQQGGLEWVWECYQDAKNKAKHKGQ